MNRFMKIIFLVLAIIVAVAGVLYFYKTIVSPPQKPTFSNQHLTSLQHDVALLDGNGEKAMADSLLYATLHAARLFQREELITAEEADDVMTKLVANFVPYFVDHYEQVFSSTVWENKTNQQIRHQATTLLNLRRLGDRELLLSDAALRQQVDTVNHILDDYKMAWAVSGQTAYHGLEAAKSTISRAKAFTQTQPINNCLELVSRLNAVPGKLEESHYNALLRQVKSLAGYRSQSEDYYKNTLAISVFAAIKEYKENAEKTYGKGVASDLTSLEKLANENYAEADAYYENQRKEKEAQEQRRNSSLLGFHFIPLNKYRKL